MLNTVIQILQHHLKIALIALFALFTLFACWSSVIVDDSGAMPRLDNEISTHMLICFNMPIQFSLEILKRDQQMVI